MPPKSEAQRKWAFANKDKPGAEGEAAREYADADEGGKLPARVSKGHGVRKDNTAKGQAGQRKIWRGA